MNNTEREVNCADLTRESFLEDIRPILDEALERRIGVNSVELWSAGGVLKSYYEKLKIYFKEENAPQMSRIEITPNSLEVDTYAPEMEDWNRSNVFFGSLNEGEAPRFYINETNTPIREIDEAEWVRVLKKARDAMAIAVSGQTKESESPLRPRSEARQRAGETEGETGGDQYFIQEYDKIMQEAESGNFGSVSTFPSELYPDYEYKAAEIFGESNSQEIVLQNFSRKVEGSNSREPDTRLLRVSDGRSNNSVSIRDLSDSVRWYDHSERQSGTPLTTEEKRQVLGSVQSVLESVKRVANK